MSESLTPFALLVAALTAGQAAALEPDQIFDKAAPSVLVVRAVDAQEKPIAVGTGIVVATGKVVTICTLLARAKDVHVRRDNVTYRATLELPDTERDLCQLDVRNLTAAPLQIGSAAALRNGQRVYAISAGGTEVAITDGVVSSLHGSGETLRAIDITTRLSKASGGGGLFDVNGRLVGVIASQLRAAQNHAVPADWVSELPERGKLALARHREGSAPATTASVSGTPRPQPVVTVGGRAERPDVRVGDRWKYQVTDTYTSLKSAVLIEVTSVTDSNIHTRSVRDNLAAASMPTGGAVDVWDRHWNPLKQGDITYTPLYSWLQFPLEPGKQWTADVRFPGPRATVHQAFTARVTGWEKVTVPAGTYDAVKITLEGNFFTSNWGGNDTPPNGSIRNAIWYAPAIRQIVKKEITERDMANSRSVNLSVLERWELIEHKVD